jgi:hypothetical protein
MTIMPILKKRLSARAQVLMLATKKQIAIPNQNFAGKKLEIVNKVHDPSQRQADDTSAHIPRIRSELYGCIIHLIILQS